MRKNPAGRWYDEFHGEFFLPENVLRKKKNKKIPQGYLKYSALYDILILIAGIPAILHERGVHFEAHHNYQQG